jgi:hypothetical protein
MFKYAAATGALDSQDLASSTKVDQLLNAKTNICKVLTQNQIDEFVTASPEKMDQLVKEFWLTDAQETPSNASTSANSSTSSNATGSSVYVAASNVHARSSV